MPDGLVHRVRLARARALVEAVEVLLGARVLVDLLLHLRRARRPSATESYPAPERTGTLDRARPLRVARRALVLGHRAARSGALAPQLADAALRPPPDADAGEERRAERGRLRHLGHHDGHAEHVGLELHEEVVLRRAAVGAQLAQSGRRRRVHRVDRVERSGRRSPRASRARGARASSPRVSPTIVPRAYGSQCGEPRPVSAGTNTTPSVDSTDRASASVSARRLDDPQAVAQPLHRRAGDEDRRLERVEAPLARSPRRPWSAAPSGGSGALVAGVEQDERAGAVRVLALAGVEAGLAVERGLLVAGDAATGTPSKPGSAPSRRAADLADRRHGLAAARARGRRRGRAARGPSGPSRMS